MCTVLMGNSSQVLIKKKKKEDKEQEGKEKKKMNLFGNFESINLQVHPSQT